MLRQASSALGFFPVNPDIAHLLVSSPDQFMAVISRIPHYLSPAFARQLDAMDPLRHTAGLFNIGDVIPFAGHSLGPIFQPALDRINETAQLQKQLHAGHFPGSHPEGSKSGHWFDCDRHTEALCAARQLLGFRHDDEFLFTANGLSDNLAKLLDTFYRPGIEDWGSGKTGIAMLATDFFSDQAVVDSVLRRAIQTARRYGAPVADGIASDQLVIRLQPDEKGIYRTEDIIAKIRLHAEKIQVICLSDIVFGTGQRLELHKIFAALKDDILRNRIFVGLDLAHTIGNRAVDLASFPVPVHFAVACGYKHISGFAGSGFGMYVNRDINLEEYPPLQGWKAADSGKVFATINHFDPDIMARSGAVAFRISNPPPVALIPAQSYLVYFGGIGFDKCFNKSECLTRYMIAQLRHHLEDVIEFVTPLDPAQRGAMIVFRIKGMSRVQVVEDELKKSSGDEAGYEIDVRPPNNIRLTAHYAYNKFEQIANMVRKLQLVVRRELDMTAGLHMRCRAAVY